MKLCLICKIEYKEFRKDQKYCGKKCGREAKKKILKEYNKINAKKYAEMKQEKKCEECSETYKARKYEHKGRERRFCDDCTYKMRTKKINDEEIKRLYTEEKYSFGDLGLLLNISNSTARKKIIELGIKTRNNSEQQIENNKLRPEKHTGEKPIKEKCRICEKEVKRYKNRIKENGVFCSPQCHNIFQTIRQKGLIYGEGWAEAKRKTRRRDIICQICKKTKEENGRELDVHHIKPLRLFENKMESHEIKNLIALCKVCHTTVDNIIRRRERKNELLRKNTERENKINECWIGSIEEARNKIRR